MEGMDAKCPQCERTAVLDEEIKFVKCPHCNFETDYESYLEIMKDRAVNMAADYLPKRPGL
jgi:ribosomal protein L37AE/L43A